MRNLRKNIVSILGVLLGALILSAGFVFFINPYKIVPGGIYGASIVLHQLFPTIQVGTFGYMFDIPLLIISFLLLGGKLGFRTVLASLTMPLMMNVLSLLAYPNTEALQALDPAQMLGGILDLSDNLMLATIIGAAMIGLGGGIVVNNGATSGGTDIIAMIMQKYLHVRFSNGIMLLDGLVVLFGGIVIGCGDNPSADAMIISLYSLIAIWIASRVVARVINGPKDDKMLFIISQQNLEKLHHFLIHELDRTATCIKCSGLYSQAEKDMLLIVVSYKEVNRIKQRIREADPTAFVIVTDAYDAFGEGWKPLPGHDEFQPE